MSDGSPLAGGGGSGSGSGSGSSVVDIYPLSRYCFGSKQAAPEKDGTPADKVQRLKTNYWWSSSNVVCVSIAMGICEYVSSFAAHGLRTCVGGVILEWQGLWLYSVQQQALLLNCRHHHSMNPAAGMQVILPQEKCQEPKVELFQQPHVLLLQVRNSFFRLPGGRLRLGESDADGLKRKLSSKLSGSENGEDDDWQIGECLGIWWRSDFETLPIPFLPSHVRKPKECTKLFLVRLPRHLQFIVPNNLKLLAVPLCQIHDDSETYGPIISGIPQLLSRFSFNLIRQ